MRLCDLWGRGGAGGKVVNVIREHIGATGIGMGGPPSVVMCAVYTCMIYIYTHSVGNGKERVE